MAHSREVAPGGRRVVEGVVVRMLVQVFAFVVLLLVASQVWVPSVAQGPTPGAACPRFATGSVVLPPPDVFSQNGALNVQLNYYTTVDQNGLTLFCFQTPSGLAEPTLRLDPGDQLNITALNAVPEGTPVEQVSNASNQCGDQVMYTSSVNIHYHGTTSSPTCHQDEVIRTVINSGETFQYNVSFPNYQPTGLYWYHPHIHGIAEAAVLGGASAALIMSGLQNYVPQIVGLPERVLLVRDQPVAGTSNPGDTCAGNSNVTPSWDLTVNYVPLQFQAANCTYTPAIVEMQAGGQELWRVCNCGADTILDLQIQYDGQVQQLQLVALDGVAIGSQNRQQQGTPETVTDILLAPAARAEFIVTGPQSGQSASFVTLNIDTGPDGDVDPTRTIATIKTDAPTKLPVIPPVTQSIPASIPVSKRLANQTPTVQRTLYFSEVLSDPTNPNSPTNFFITVDGATPVLFDPNNPPAIVTHQGAIEDWTIENRALENHEFHMHQIHFLVESQSGYSVPQEIGQFLDMVQVPYWSGSGPYPSVTVRMDFGGVDVGDFVYHCHILGHEDAGMMAIIRVLPSQPATHDFNGDGHSDIVWRDTSGNVAIWLMNGAAVLSTGGVGGTGPAWSIVGQRDFNGDGDADLLWRDNNGNTAIWFMNGSQIASSAGVGNIPTTWSVVGTGDFNGDGFGDILWQDSNGDLAIWLMNGTTVMSSAGVGNVPILTYTLGGIGDFNGDGMSDILWRDTSGNTSIWFMNGTQVASAAGIGNISTNWSVAGTGDFNGDGMADIAWRDTAGDTSIWLMNGAAVLSAGGLGNVPNTWSIPLTGDYDGDGKADLLWRNNTGDTSIWFMNGTTVASTGSVGNIPTSWTVQSAGAE
jgi:FtsP/CotA-like multicopper oxidase with cupredoxin domain